ncbi:MAG TPA: kelch repeat-containing protein, partial [bacterium]|nr:kelch repeat-containing protein [bacterium]
LELDWNGLAFELAENKSDKSFTYTYVVRKEDSEIEYLFTIIATDMAGNKTDIIDLGKVKIDRTSPDLSSIAMFKNESEHGLSSNLYLKHGDILRFELEVNEEIAEIPQMKLGIYDIPCEEGKKELSFDCSLTIDKDVTYDVVADISLSFNDIAGNIYSRSIVSGAKIDTQVPQFIFRKNKDPQDYNATDTIVLTITANEPVSMIEVDGTELDNTLTSWNIEGKNITGTFEVKLKAADLAGNEQPGFTVGTYKVDADYPEAVISAPTPDRISGTGSTAIIVNGFNKPVQSVKLNGTECIGEGAKTCTFDAPFGSGDSVETLSMQLTDFVGNVTNLNAGTVYVDRTPPQIAGDATVIFKKPAGCPLSSVSSITSGSSIDISFIVNEPLKEIGDPLVSAYGDVNIIAFNMTGQIGYFYTFSKETINTEFLTDGTYVFKIEIEDEVGNKNNITLSQGFEIDTAKPDAPFVDIPDKITYRRVPHGSEATGYEKVFSVSSSEGAVENDVSSVFIYDESDNIIGSAKIKDNKFDDIELVPSNRPVVFISSFDDACNESEKVQIRDVEWIITMGGKIPDSSNINPHIFESVSSFSGTLFYSDSIQRGHLDNIAALDSSVLSDHGTGKWKKREFAALDTIESSAVAFDTARGVAVMFGGKTNSDPTDKTYEWDGYLWKEVILSDPEGDGNPSARYNHSMVYNAVKDRVVLFGGWTDKSENSSEMWEYDGKSWEKIVPQSVINPTARNSHAMVYDVFSNKIILFGGLTASGRTDELWEFDGESWEKITPQSDINPTARNSHAMVYDVFSNKIILFGGLTASGRTDELWEFDGESWEKITPESVQNPAARNSHAMIYNILSNKIILFGGLTDSGINDELWEFDGESWEEIIPQSDINPTERNSQMMFYDTINSHIILFGGISDEGEMGDAWKYDDGKWKEMSDPSKNETPDERMAHAAAYDSKRQRTVLFGGDVFYYSWNDETWEWNDGQWEQIVPESMDNPDLRGYHSMVFDEVSEKVILFGGLTDWGASEEMWEWDGKRWDLVIPESFSNPAGRDSHAAVYDSEQNCMILFGGWTDSGAENIIWKWDGRSWEEVVPATSDVPTVRFSHAMAYDKNRNRIVLFGGLTEDGINDETWEWDGAKWEKIIPENNIFPSARHGHSMIYDESLQKVLLYGGNTAEGSEEWNGELWGWNGTKWEKFDISKNSSSARGYSSLIYDSYENKSVVFGGKAQSGLNNDIFEWHGGAERYPAHLVRAVLNVPEMVDSFELRGVEAKIYSGATGYGEEDVSGAELKVWLNGMWNSVDSNTVSHEGLSVDPENGMLYWSSDDRYILDKIVTGREKLINFALTPLFPNKTEKAVISTDYCEITVKYTVK